MGLFKKKRDKEIEKKIFDYFTFERTPDGGINLFGDFADKGFSNWLAYVHGQIQALLKTKMFDGIPVENYVNITLYVGGQKVEVSIIKDGGKGPHEIIQEARKRAAEQDESFWKNVDPEDLRSMGYNDEEIKRIKGE